MIPILATPEKMLWVALALTAMLTVAPGRYPLFLWDRAHSTPTRPRWLPWLVLAAFAIASGFYGIACPEQFAAIFGQGVLDPALLVAARGQP